MWTKWTAKASELRENLLALYLAYGDPRTPLGAKVCAIIVVAYALSPIDLIPDFIPVLGYLDDLMLVPFGIAIALRTIPDEVMADAHKRAKEGVDPPNMWGATVTVIVIWFVILAWMVRVVWRLWHDWPEG